MLSRPAAFVTREGTNLYLDGAPYRFTGVTAASATTYWPVNWGCGSQVDDLDGFFSSLPANSMVLIGAMQAQAFNNKTTHAIDFTPIDRVVQAAERQGQKLTIALADQQGTCDDGHWKGEAWYDGGYKQAFDDSGLNLTHLSYWDYIHLIVPRYKDSKAVAIWLPIGEPEASDCASGYLGGACYGHTACPSGAANSLRTFYDTVGAEVKSLDPNHLVSTGTLSGLQCGLSGAGYRQLIESPYVDVANFHDYGLDGTSLPADLGTALTQAHAANKVFVMDEGGMYAGGWCQTRAQRSNQFKAKMDAQFLAGSSGFQAWNWVPITSAPCSMDIAPDDPLMSLLRAYRPA